jgi:L-alanine-DL-glutamate epimerase-like enolase superfamily enzyme
LKIVDVVTERFRYKSRRARDSEGHSHPGPERDATECVLKIVTDDGAEGYSFGANEEVIQGVARPALIGEDPFFREKIWQHLFHWQRSNRTMNDRVLATIDLALWDLAGRALNQPVYKLLGASRDRVLAYASTMCGDEMPGGLSSPEDYASFALACKARGYRALKLHTWMPPIEWAPDVRRDAACCLAVREAVGPDMPLMLDCYHGYTREEARQLGKALERANYYWIEEPMDEHSISSYEWLTRELDIPVVGPETAEGKGQTRAEWIVRNASDISRGGVFDNGGITPLMKIVGLCESHGVQLEIHSPGAGNLHALCAMGIKGEFYERGLLHPFLDYETPDPWLNEIVDPMDDQGYVHVSPRPGLGQDINWDYIREHRVTR